MDFNTAYQKASAICGQQESCRSDIENKLVNWNVDEETIEKVITCLLEEKFIDENRYAGFYARDKFKFNGWGKYKIKWNLLQKKIPSEIIQTAIETIDCQEYENKLTNLLKEKADTIKDKDKVKKKAALVRFALSRGFEMNEIMPLINKMIMI
jgi:regulatory protein